MHYTCTAEYIGWYNILLLVQQYQLVSAQPLLSIYNRSKSSCNKQIWTRFALKVWGRGKLFCVMIKGMILHIACCQHFWAASSWRSWPVWVDDDSNPSVLHWCHPHHIRCMAEREHNCVITNVYRCRLLAAGESRAAWEVAQSTARCAN